MDKAAKNSPVVAALQASSREVKDEMEAMEKRQRKADEKAMEEERQDRGRERQRILELEERWRREDREHALQAQREDRDFRLAMMSMMKQQTSLMARMINEDERPHSSHSMHMQMPQQPPSYAFQQSHDQMPLNPHCSHIPPRVLPGQMHPHANVHQEQMQPMSAVLQRETPHVPDHSVEQKEYTIL